MQPVVVIGAAAKGAAPPQMHAQRARIQSNAQAERASDIRPCALGPAKRLMAATFALQRWKAAPILHQKIAFG
jgi:hypothetical protein